MPALMFSYPRQVLDVADPARPMPADQVILLRVHHVDVLAGDQLGLGDRMILARHQLVIDVLVIQLFEDVDILGHDLRIVLPADEMQGIRRCRQGAADQPGRAQRRRGGEPPFQHRAPAHQIVVQPFLSLVSAMPHVRLPN
jgi:hypothetical protein